MGPASAPRAPSAAAARATGALAPAITKLRRRAIGRAQDLRGPTPPTEKFAGLVREVAGRMNFPHNILVPVELGVQTEPVLDYAVALAAKLDARLHLLHVVGRPLLGSEVAISVTETNMDEILERCQQQLEYLAAERAAKAPFGPVLLKIGDPRAVIDATAAELGIDLIVMGTHGRRGVARVLLGSVAETVVRTACCPVLLVRTGGATARGYADAITTSAC